MTKTNLKYLRAYLNGVDLSGYSRTMGMMGGTADAQPDAAWTDGVKNIVLGQSTMAAGPYNTILDNDTAGAFANLSTMTQRNFLLTIGMNAAPVAGDPVFAWNFEQTTYAMETGNGFIAANVTFEPTYNILTYKKPWGFLLHASGAETAVNTAVGQDDYGASTALGGMFAYQLLSSNGTVTLKAQHASTNSNGSFSDLTAATSGSINASVTPQSGMVELSSTLTINRYTRWQLVFGTATTATFVMALIRNTIA